MSKAEDPKRPRKRFRPDTEIAHLGRAPHEHHGAVNTPVYRVSTILHPSLAHLEGRSAQRFTYGRRGNPNAAGLEESLTVLSGGAACVLTPSGLSAVTLALMTAAQGGGHLLISDSAYDPSRTFAEKALTQFGATIEFYDPLIAGQIAQKFKANTRAVLVESPGSLTFEVQDLPAIATAAHANGIAVIADNTWASPLLAQPLALGADMVVEACTKYIVGHADASIGAVIANEPWSQRLRDLHGALGLCAAPDDIFLAQRGLRTLPVRLRQHQETATTLATWLSQRPEVERVLYPALPSDPGHALWARDFKGASGLFGVVLRPLLPKALAAMLDGLALFGMGYSWGGFESLIVPAKPHRAVKPHQGGTLLRIHAGLEDVRDLIGELEAGFERARAIA